MNKASSSETTGDLGIPANLDPRALQRVSGAAWSGLRSQFIDVSIVLLRAAPDVRSALTTIYVKFDVAVGDGRVPFAVVWLKRSAEMVVGLALPTHLSVAGLLPPPISMKYPRLTQYCVIPNGGTVPVQFEQWATIAARSVLAT